MQWLGAVLGGSRVMDDYGFGGARSPSCFSKHLVSWMNLRRWGVHLGLDSSFGICLAFLCMA